MLTFREKLQGEEKVSVAVGADVINTMNKFRLLLSLALLIQARSIAPKLILLTGQILRKPIPEMIKSIYAWVPATASVVTTHALSGATTEVRSYQGNSISVEKGEDVNFQFFTSRYTAGSYRISGLPNGLNYDGSNSITGAISETGSYNVEITGYRGGNQTGSVTPAFSLAITVTEPEGTIGSGDELIDNFEEISDLGNNWYQAWFGVMYIPSSGNWIFHSRLGWLYAQPDGQDSFWFFDESLGWLYSSKNLAGYFYRHSDGGWLYQLESSSINRFWDFQQNAEI